MKYSAGDIISSEKYGRYCLCRYVVDAGYWTLGDPETGKETRYRGLTEENISFYYSVESNL